MDRNYTTCYFKLFIFLILTILPFASFAKPVFSITTSSSSINLSRNGQTNALFTITNVSGANLPLTTYEANFLSPKYTSESINSSASTCQQNATLAKNASCILAITIHAGGSIGADEIKPRACAFRGQLCSTVSTGLRVNVNGGTTPPTPPTPPPGVSVTLSIPTQFNHLQYRSLQLTNTGTVDADVDNITTDLASTSLNGSVELCDSGNSFCNEANGNPISIPESGQPTTCQKLSNNTLSAGSSCLIWFHSIDSTTLGATGPASVEVTVQDGGATLVQKSFNMTFEQDIYAGGTINGAFFRIAKWDGTSFSALGSGLNNSLFALDVYNGDLIAGGAFTSAGSASPTNGIARWDGSEWHAFSSLLSGGSETVMALTVINSDLFVGGNFTTAGGNSANNIAMWNGSSWSALGSGTNGEVNALANDGTNVYAGGAFSTAGGVGASNIAQWDGTNWNFLGTIAGDGVDDTVNALSQTGSSLFVGGNFLNTVDNGASTSASRIAEWNGATWAPLGNPVAGQNGVSGNVFAVAANNTNVFVGGNFSDAINSDGTTTVVSNTARWSIAGSSWNTMGTGTNSIVRTFFLFGTDAYAGGSFTSAGGVANTNRIAFWDGANWNALSSGFSAGTIFAQTSASSVTISN